MDNKIRLITHDDLDGAGAEILFKVVYGSKAKVDVVNYGNVNKIVKKILAEDNESDIILCDISVNEEVAEIINKKNLEYNKGDWNEVRIALLDHHKTAEWLSCKYPLWARIETEECGTLMLFEALMTMVEDDIDKSLELKLYGDFAYLVDDYDRWLHNNPLSKKHNTLFYLIGRDKYVSRMLEFATPYLDDSEKLILEVEEARKQRYLESRSKDIYWSGNDIIVFAEKYISELGHYLLKKYDAGMVIIINFTMKKVSVRSKPAVDCSIFCKNYGGGGHKNASGFELSEMKIGKILDSIFI